MVKKAKMNYDTPGQIAPKCDPVEDFGKVATPSAIFANKNDTPKRKDGKLNGPKFGKEPNRGKSGYTSSHMSGEKTGY